MLWFVDKGECIFFDDFFIFLYFDNKDIFFGI